jgi:hypothetical protein
MPTTDKLIIHLDPCVLEAQWSFLHRFLHPGSWEKDKRATLFAELSQAGTSSLAGFLKLRVKDFQGGGTANVHIPTRLVFGAVAYESDKTPLGFHPPDQSAPTPEHIGFDQSS